jgi:hypothetical protein
MIQHSSFRRQLGLTAKIVIAVMVISLEFSTQNNTAITIAVRLLSAPAIITSLASTAAVNFHGARKRLRDVVPFSVSACLPFVFWLSGCGFGLAQLPHRYLPVCVWLIEQSSEASPY